MSSSRSSADTGACRVTRHVDFRAWRDAAGLGHGTTQGAEVLDGILEYGAGAGLRTYTDPHAEQPVATRYCWSAWVSPPVAPGFAFTSVIPSWNACTPAGTWVEIEARVMHQQTASRWYTLARWADSDLDIHPTSVPGQDGPQAVVATDVLQAPANTAWTSYQLRVSLLRRPEATEGPSVRLLAAVVADDGSPWTEPSEPGVGRGVELQVPAYSQQIHAGEYARWDSGGESWCSPTSTSMVLAFWGRGPTAEDYAWVADGIADPFVAHAARSVFDYAYGGAGNWSFNTAYAARFGTTAFVTRLRDLTEAEQFIAAGVPLVATVSFEADELAGAGYGTEGHLLTIVGFDDEGNVICNDPASHGVASNDEVRTVYDRGQFERVWIGRGGGVVYVIHPPDVPLPPAPSEPNW